jgi:choline-glycine betaine transporter
MLRILIDGIWVLGAVVGLAACFGVLIVFIGMGLAACFGVEPN